MKANSAGLFSLSHMAPSLSTGDQPPPAPTDAQVDRSPRVRTTTLDRFNQEMSVLDQPLDGEVEYYDEPQPRRWRVPAIGMAIFALTFGGYLTAARYRHAPQVSAREPSAPPAAEFVAAVPAPPSASAVATPAQAATAAAPATKKPEPASADKPAAPSTSVALQAKADGHHHHRSHHASGRHRHGGHAHHAV